MNEDISKALEEIKTKAPREEESVEFQVNEDFVKQLPAILSNVADLQRWADSVTANDKALVLTSEEDIEKAKARCAQYNKVITQIDDKRKDIKKAYIKPYEVFEKQLKNVTKTLTDAKDNLWYQVKHSDEEIKNVKRQKITDYYNEKADDLVMKYRPLDMIFDEAWLNKTVRLEKVYAELDKIMTEAKSDIQLICDLHTKYEPALLLKYKEGASFTDIIVYHMQLRKENSPVESEKTDEQVNTPQQAETASQAQNSPPAPTESEEVRVIDFRIWATNTQLAALRTFLNDNNIKYGRIPKNTEVK